MIRARVGMAAVAAALALAGAARAAEAEGTRLPRRRWASEALTPLRPAGRAGGPAARRSDQRARLESILSEAERIVAAERSAHPLEVRKLDGRIQSFGREIRRMDRDAVPRLGEYLRDGSRPYKARLYAAAFLGLHGDPEAMSPLRAAVLDPKEDPGARFAALSAIGSLRIEPVALKRFLEAVAADERMPEPLAREAWARLGALGTDRVDLAVAAAKGAGNSPGPPGDWVPRQALRALGRSPAPSAQEALLDLLRWFRRGSPLREDALAAFEERRPRWGEVRPDGYAALASALLEDPGRTAVRAARVLKALAHPAAAGALMRALRSEDPAVAAEAAEALAEIGLPEARPALVKLEEGMVRDARFAPSPGGPDVASLAARVARASARLQDRLSPRPIPRELVSVFGKPPTLPSPPPREPEAPRPEAPERVPPAAELPVPGWEEEITEPVAAIGAPADGAAAGPKPRARAAPVEGRRERSQEDLLKDLLRR